MFTLFEIIILGEGGGGGSVTFRGVATSVEIVTFRGIVTFRIYYQTLNFIVSFGGVLQLSGVVTLGT